MKSGSSWSTVLFTTFTILEARACLHGEISRQERSHTLKGIYNPVSFPLSAATWPKNHASCFMTSEHGMSRAQTQQLFSSHVSSHISASTGIPNQITTILWQKKGAYGPCVQVFSCFSLCCKSDGVQGYSGTINVQANYTLFSSFAYW